MEVKIIEIRDLGTFVPAVCIKMQSDDHAERYLLGRAGFARDSNLIQMLITTTGRTEYDPFKWNDRTFYNAHDFIYREWERLETGAVVDVQVVLGETRTPKLSERIRDERN